MSTLSLRLVTVAAVASQSTASLHLSNVFGSNMVLQRAQPIPVWGWGAAAGASVAVAVDGGSPVVATADGTGFWRVALPAMAASLAPHSIAASSGAETAMIDNVLVGDVFLCSGQR